MISTFLVRGLVEELKFLEDSRLKKVDQVGKELFKLQFIKDRKKRDILVEVGVRINETKYKFKVRHNKSIFSQLLVKELSKDVLKKIYQHNFDRIVVFEFEKHNLIFEFFSKGNIILTDNDFNIVQTFKSQSWKDRTIKKSEKYKFPPSSEINFENIFTKQDIVRSLALNLKVGGKYAEKLCELSGVDKNKSKPTDEEIKKLKENYEKIITDSKYIFEIEFENKEYDSLNLAVDKKYPPVEFKEDSKLILLGKRLEEQESALDEFKKQSEELQEKGNLLYANFDKVLTILNLWKKKDKTNLSRLGAKEKDKNLEIELD